MAVISIPLLIGFGTSLHFMQIYFKTCFHTKWRFIPEKSPLASSHRCSANAVRYKYFANRIMYVNKWTGIFMYFVRNDVNVDILQQKDFFRKSYLNIPRMFRDHKRPSKRMFWRTAIKSVHQNRQSFTSLREKLDMKTFFLSNNYLLFAFFSQFCCTSVTIVYTVFPA